MCFLINIPWNFISPFKIKPFFSTEFFSIINLKINLLEWVKGDKNQDGEMAYRLKFSPKPFRSYIFLIKRNISSALFFFFQILSSQPLRFIYTFEDILMTNWKYIQLNNMGIKGACPVQLKIHTYL